MNNQMTNTFILELRVSIRDSNPGNFNNRLEVTENQTIHASDFLEVCKILATFHDIAKGIK